MRSILTLSLVFSASLAQAALEPEQAYMRVRNVLIEKALDQAQGIIRTKGDIFPISEKLDLSLTESTPGQSAWFMGSYQVNFVRADMDPFATPFQVECMINASVRKQPLAKFTGDLTVLENDSSSMLTAKPRVSCRVL